MSAEPIPTADDIVNAAQRSMRILAFGAIRRAATLARTEDLAASLCQGTERRVVHRHAATMIRCAIRVAMRADS